MLRILKHTPDDHFRFLFYVLWKTGFRPQEVLRWEWTFFGWNQPNKTWADIPSRISKTDRMRSVSINPGVSRRLHALWLAGNGSIFVFPHKRRPDKPRLAYNFAWRDSCAAAGVVNSVPYDCRRTFITRAAVDKEQMLYVAKHLDTSIAMIEKIYAKVDRDTMEAIAK